NKSAVGLIQFTSVAAEELKISKQELALMTEIEQLDYVKKYFEIGGRNKKIKNGQEMYLTIFCPAAVHKDKDYVLYSKEKDTKHGKSHYEANKSIDEENNNDKKIQRWEAVSRVLKAKTQGVSRKYINQCKIDISTCTNIVYEGTEDNSDGVLEEMKKLADKHIPYKQQVSAENRTGDSEKAMSYMDCSEFVSRYLFKLKISDKERIFHTGQMISQETFRKAINSKNIDFVSGSTEKSFIPKRGDIFIWRRPSGGHTGIVYQVDSAKNQVTILESLVESVSSSEKYNKENGGDNLTNCTRTSVYKINGGALSAHKGWKGYFRPKNYKKTL
ncbi:CHAP domain-containing protein, partial [Tenacibaculum finnmarkense]|uniref:CHAP domain-containing protein n=1 Tax=Tenacibaculum finnmarkense TaxID=2781243 RepID=UPI001EFBBBE6